MICSFTSSQSSTSRTDSPVNWLPTPGLQARRFVASTSTTLDFTDSEAEKDKPSACKMLGRYRSLTDSTQTHDITSAASSFWSSVARLEVTVCLLKYLLTQPPELITYQAHQLEVKLAAIIPPTVPYRP
ncbi:hypothetical protein ABKN59_011819 [Abortiporus biennis]